MEAYKDIRVLSDGTCQFDGGAAFGIVPKAVWARFIECDDANCVPMGTNCLLVDVPGGYALVEAGMGDVFPDEPCYDIPISGPRLPDRLAEVNVDVGEVKWVILSHLHFDHAGWIARRKGDGFVPTFPNARCVVQKRELDDAANPVIRMRESYVDAQWRTIDDAGLWHVVDGEAEVCDGIRVIHTGGHCEGHQIALIERGDTTVVFWGDLASGWLHLRPAWTVAYDTHPDETIRLKVDWMERIFANNWIVVSYHDWQFALARLRRNARGRMEPVRVG